MQTVRLLLTLSGMVAPSAAIMDAMGWTSAVHLALLGPWALISTALIVAVPARHRRAELRKQATVLTLIGWVGLGAIVLGANWHVRPVVASLLLLPGLSYLLLEVLGLTPRPPTRGSPLP